MSSCWTELFQYKTVTLYNLPPATQCYVKYCNENITTRCFLRLLKIKLETSLYKVIKTREALMFNFNVFGFLWFKIIIFILFDEFDLRKCFRLVSLNEIIFKSTRILDN